MAEKPPDAAKVTDPELTSLFKIPVPEEVLSRYALVGLGTVPTGPGDDTLLYERTPVDELYDTRYVLGARMSRQIETNPAIYVVTRALVAYGEANSGRIPTQPDELSPYLEAPLETPMLTRYFNDWQKQPATLGINRASVVTIFRTIGGPR